MIGKLLLAPARKVFWIFLLVLCQELPSWAQSQNVIYEKAITFGKGDSVDLKLDLARPSKYKGPYPALVYVFGGEFYSGGRAEFGDAIIHAAKRGYVAVTVDYRLTSEHDGSGKYFRFPDQVYDVKCAVRWLRANASKYNIDPNRIGAVGWAAGGNLALMLGVTSPRDGLEGEGGNSSYSSAVQAVVSLSGPADLACEYKYAAYSMGPYLYLGGSPAEVPERYKRASPITYVSRESPPVLVVCGELDNSIVPAECAEQFGERMKSVGASFTLAIKKGAGHSLDAHHGADDGAVWEFLAQHLK